MRAADQFLLNDIATLSGPDPHISSQELLIVGFITSVVSKNAVFGAVPKRLINVCTHSHTHTHTPITKRALQLFVSTQLWCTALISGPLPAPRHPVEPVVSRLGEDGDCGPCIARALRRGDGGPLGLGAGQRQRRGRGEL